jgi:hypothetical protein
VIVAYYAQRKKPSIIAPIEAEKYLDEEDNLVAEGIDPLDEYISTVNKEKFHDIQSMNAASAVIAAANAAYPDDGTPDTATATIPSGAGVGVNRPYSKTYYKDVLQQRREERLALARAVRMIVGEDGSKYSRAVTFPDLDSLPAYKAEEGETYMGSISDLPRISTHKGYLKAAPSHITDRDHPIAARPATEPIQPGEINFDTATPLELMDFYEKKGYANPHTDHRPHERIWDKFYSNVPLDLAQHQAARKEGFERNLNLLTKDSAVNSGASTGTGTGTGTASPSSPAHNRMAETALWAVTRSGPGTSRSGASAGASAGISGATETKEGRTNSEEAAAAAGGAGFAREGRAMTKTKSKAKAPTKSREEEIEEFLSLAHRGRYSDSGTSNGNNNNGNGNSNSNGSNGNNNGTSTGATMSANTTATGGTGASAGGNGNGNGSRNKGRMTTAEAFYSVVHRRTSVEDRGRGPASLVAAAKAEAEAEIEARLHRQTAVVEGAHAGAVRAGAGTETHASIIADAVSAAKAEEKGATATGSVSQHKVSTMALIESFLSKPQFNGQKKGKKNNNGAAATPAPTALAVAGSGTGAGSASGTGTVAVSGMASVEPTKADSNTKSDDQAVPIVGEKEDGSPPALTVEVEVEGSSEANTGANDIDRSPMVIGQGQQGQRQDQTHGQELDLIGTPMEPLRLSPVYTSPIRPEVGRANENEVENEVESEVGNEVESEAEGVKKSDEQQT